MPTPLAQRIVLSAHPSSPSEAIGGLQARVQTPTATTLALTFSLQADMARIRVPEAMAATKEMAGRADELWKHTCFEAFIAPLASTDYYELNFSPARQWAAYRFTGYRQGMSVLELAAPPWLDVRRCAQGLELDARVELPHVLDTHNLKLALCAVVEEQSGTLRYWAARHPPGKPDFHHPDGFVVELTGRA